MPDQKQKTLGNVRKGKPESFNDSTQINTLKKENLTLLERIAKLQAKLGNVDTRLRVLERERNKYGKEDASNKAAEKRLLDLLDGFDNEKSL